MQNDAPDEVVEAVTWATREAARNVERHSGVSSVVIHARDRDGGVEIVVRDQGRGFDPNAIRGFGLSNSIRQRVQDVGGTVDVWSDVGRGTRLTIWAPC